MVTLLPCSLVQQTPIHHWESSSLKLVKSQNPAPGRSQAKKAILGEAFAFKIVLHYSLYLCHWSFQWVWASKNCFIEIPSSVLPLQRTLSSWPHFDQAKESRNFLASQFYVFLGNETSSCPPHCSVVVVAAWSKVGLYTIGKTSLHCHFPHHTFSQWEGIPPLL